MKVIEVSNLSKKYQDEYAVNDLSFSVEKNSVVGLIGLNGAGKTTTMKLLMGLIKSNGGKIKILDKDITYGMIPDDVRYLKDVPGFYDYMTAFEYLKFILDINNYQGSDTTDKINNTLKQSGLYEDRDKRIGKFSRGMRQRIGIASSIISDPKILILDEPVSALDPVGRKEMFEQISKLKEHMTIIFSTHILDDVERVCNKVVLIKDGSKIKDGSIKEIKQTYIKNILEVTFMNEEGYNKFSKDFSIDKNKVSFVEEDLKIYLDSDDLKILSKKVFVFLTDNDIEIESLIIKKPTLEEIFIKEVLL